MNGPPAAMDLTDLRRLACPACGRPTDVLVLLDRLEESWRSESWADVSCPECGHRVQLSFEGEDVAIGFVSETPRAIFQPSDRTRQPGLRTSAAPDALVLELWHRRWVVARAKSGR
jgi:hypothetical protein